MMAPMFQGSPGYFCFSVSRAHTPAGRIAPPRLAPGPPGRKVTEQVAARRDQQTQGSPRSGPAQPEPGRGVGPQRRKAKEPCVIGERVFRFSGWGWHTPAGLRLRRSAARTALRLLVPPGGESQALAFIPSVRRKPRRRNSPFRGIGHPLRIAKDLSNIARARMTYRRARLHR